MTLKPKQQAKTSKSQRSQSGIRSQREFFGSDVSQMRTLSIRNGGAGWRGNISDLDRDWTAQREPIAYRHTYTVAADIFDTWFRVEEVAEKPDPLLNDRAQQVLEELNARKVLIEATAYERIFGVSLIVGGFDDAKTAADLATEKKQGAKLLQIEPYSKLQISSEEKNKDKTSRRFGLVDYYVLDRGSGIEKIRVHYSRVIRFATRPREQSVLDVMWDDMTIAKNERWSMGQTLFRYGPGFPVFTAKNAKGTKLQKIKEDIKDNWTAWTGFVTNEELTVEFKGASGAALNPTPYYEPIFDNLSLATSTPSAMLKGANAGALTGSEVNVRDYFKYISTQQSLLEPYGWQLLDWLFESGQIQAKQAVMGDSATAKLKRNVMHWLNLDQATEAPEYKITWNSGYEDTEREKATVQVLKEQINQIKLRYMLIDEIRAENGLEKLPNGMGQVLSQPAGGGFGGGGSAPPQPGVFKTPAASALDQVDQTRQTQELAPALEDPALQANAHPSLPAFLKYLAKQVITGEVDRDVALPAGRRNDREVHES